MNWFKKHINLTFISVVVVTNIAGLVAVGTGDPIAVIGVMLPLGIVLIITEVWYLRQKGRSLWFLLLNLLNWIGLLILLSLENRRFPSRYPEDKVML